MEKSGLGQYCRETPDLFSKLQNPQHPVFKHPMGGAGEPAQQLRALDALVGEWGLLLPARPLLVFTGTACMWCAYKGEGKHPRLKFKSKQRQPPVAQLNSMAANSSLFCPGELTASP